MLWDIAGVNIQDTKTAVLHMMFSMNQAGTDKEDIVLSSVAFLFIFEANRIRANSVFCIEKSK